MRQPSDDPVLAFVDLVLSDLRLRGKMFVGRGQEPDGPETVVIHSGTDGRHQLARPELTSADSVQAFVGQAQAHVGTLYGVPVPACPLHDHALICRADERGAEWVCPHGEWRCAVGEYEDRTWPPSGYAAGDMAAALASRLRQRGITGWRRLGARHEDGRWIATIGVWPIDDAVTARLREAAAPLSVEVTPLDPGPADAWQKALDRRFADELEWARWAVERWSGFPVDQDPRPLVLLGDTVLVEDGFASGDAKLAFILGRVEADASVPGAALAALQKPQGSSMMSGRPLPPPLVISGASAGETDFRTDRGPRTLPAYRLSGEGISGVIWVLRPEVAARAWAPHDPAADPPPSSQIAHHFGHEPAALEADGRTLTYTFNGAPPEYEQYPRAEVIESEQAVVVVPQAKDVGQPGLPRRAVGRRLTVTVTLRQPLGTRVLLDPRGHPREVIVAA